MGTIGKRLITSLLKSDKPIVLVTATVRGDVAQLVF